MELQQMMAELRKPFHPARISWKPGAVKGERALAMAYADLRVYMDRLDEVCGGDWSVAYDPWGPDRIICRLTIAGVTRSSTGESSAESDRNEIGGTVAEAQAMKRACAMFGLGRYLYALPTTWADYDAKTRQFTEQAKAKLATMLATHYRKATDGKPGTYSGTEPQAEDNLFDEKTAHPPAKNGETPRVSQARLNRLHAVGTEAYGKAWDEKRAQLVEMISKGAATSSRDLTPKEAEELIAGIEKKLAQASKQREPAYAG